ncbi:MAG: hypothetical protein HY200_08530 [Nitrospirae bacterium]|nr:hypothetical protein [Nitrospirota bacterium]MBI3594990.1 hypothetical protein [Nitrospirota bacterium]
MNNQSGKITLGFLLFLGLVAVGLDASFQIVPIYMNYLNFKSEIESRAMEPQATSDSGDRIRSVLIKKAVEFQIPLDPDELKIEYGDHSTHIIASWKSEAKFLGGHFSKIWPFTVDVNKGNYRS